LLRQKDKKKKKKKKKKRRGGRRRGRGGGGKITLFSDHSRSLLRQQPGALAQTSTDHMHRGVGTHAREGADVGGPGFDSSDSMARKHSLAWKCRSV